MTAERLLENASDERDQARIRAAFSKESGAWLQALPVSLPGLRMDDNTVRVAIGLRLGSPLCWYLGLDQLFLFSCLLFFLTILKNSAHYSHLLKSKKDINFF